MALDLFIGAWISGEADGASISRVVEARILVTTFMFGPFGLLLFLMVWKAQNLVLQIHHPMKQGAE